MRKIVSLMAFLLSSTMLMGSLTELRLGYWKVNDPSLDRLYDEPGFDIQLIESKCIYGPLHLYMAIGYLKKGGYSKEDSSKTTLCEVPFSLGLQACMPINHDLEAYATLGPRYTFVHTTNHSAFVPEVLKQHALVFFANSGVYYHLGDLFLIDFFVEYANTKVKMAQLSSHPSTTKRQVGGFSFGIGVGYSF